MAEGVHDSVPDVVYPVARLVPPSKPDIQDTRCRMDITNFHHDNYSLPDCPIWLFSLNCLHTPDKLAQSYIFTPSSSLTLMLMPLTG